MMRSYYKQYLKYAVAQIPEAFIAGSVLCLRPIDDLLCGLFFDPSGFSADDFYVDVFVQTLFVPHEHIIWPIGFRLKDEHGGTRWHRDKPDAEIARQLTDAITRQALPFISQYD